MTVSCRLVFLVVVLVSGCSKTANPEVCCTDPTDCASIGAEEQSRPCPTALTCVNHECVVPDCSTNGCSAAQPVCNLASNACEGCIGNADCVNFPGQERCLADTGACVQCVTSNDCGPTVPVCAGNTCRRCERDAECPSQACGDDGACVPESSIAYVDPFGDDGGACTKAQPCRSLGRAVAQTTASRPHIVIAKATYAVSNGSVLVTSATTSAPRVFIHGGDASFVGNFGDPIIVAQVATTIRDLKLQQQIAGAGIRIDGTAPQSVIERVTVESNRGLQLFGHTLVRDVTLTATLGKERGIEISSTSFELDRVTVKGFDECIATIFTSSVSATIRNTVASDCGVRAVNLQKTSGVIEFSTFVTQGAGSGIGARGIDCGMESSLTIRGSIVWSPSASTPVVQGCNAVSSIIGPTAFAGSSNADPKFADLAAGDFHLQTGSPARDALDTGPAVDVVGNPRPIGGKFDLGAYEQ